MFVYCAKCGHIKKETNSMHCAVCQTPLQKVPSRYLSASGNLFQSQDARNLFIKEVIETGSLYDKDLSQHRDDILQSQATEHEKAVSHKVQAHLASRPTYRCPVCGSTNLSAISTVGKIAKISLLGIWGAGDLGKKRRCDSCGHKF